MSSSFGVSTEDMDGTDRIWPGTAYELTNLNYTHIWPGGPASLTCRVVAPEGVYSPGFGIGRILRLWRGTENIWTGVLTQPSAGSEGMGLTATGLASLSSRWITTVGGDSKPIESFSGSISTVSGGPFTVISGKGIDGGSCLQASAAGTATKTFASLVDISGYGTLTLQISTVAAGTVNVTYTMRLTDANGINWSFTDVTSSRGLFHYARQFFPLTSGVPANFDKTRVSSWTLTVNRACVIDDMRVEPSLVDNQYIILADPNVDAAISRGLPWSRRSSAQSAINGITKLGGSLKAMLDAYADQSDYKWSVDALGRMTWSLPPTTPVYHLRAHGQGGTRTVDGFATDVYAAYSIVTDQQIDSLDEQVSQGTGAPWTIDKTHMYQGEACAANTGASNSTAHFSSPVSLRDYTAISFRLAAPVVTSVNVTMILFDITEAQWNLGTQLFNVDAGYIWGLRTFTLTNKPTMFDIDNIERWELDFDQGVLIDDMRAVPPTGATARVTAPSFNAASRAKYGRWETAVDLNGQGPLNDTDASAVAKAGLAKYGYSARWTQPFLAVQGDLTNAGGQPVDITTVTAGCVVRVFAASLGVPEVADLGDAINILIGETSYDESTGVLTISPVDIERQDLVALLGQLPIRKQ